jgi:hypothetical protein
MTSAGKERARKERESWPIEDILDSWAAQDTKKEEWASHELLKDEHWTVGSVPIAWEPAVIQASLRSDIRWPHDFLGECAELLIGMHSNHPRLPELLAEIKLAKPGLQDFYLTYEYAKQQNWTLTRNLRSAFQAAIQNLRPLRRTIFLIDGNIRTILKICKDQPQPNQ